MGINAQSWLYLVLMIVTALGVMLAVDWLFYRDDRKPQTKNTDSEDDAPESVTYFLGDFR